MLTDTPDRVRSYLDLPPNATIEQFIVRDNTDPARLAQQYALTTAIRPRLEELLRDIKEAIARSSDLGRSVFGSFGSGKSHFLRIAGMMLANDQRLGANARDAGLREVRAASSWLDGTRILVVHTSMMGVEEHPNAFIRHLADAYDQALEELGAEPLRAFGVEAAFAQFEAQCSKVSDYFQAFEHAEGYDRAKFDRIRSQPHGDSDRLALARIVAQWVSGSESAFQPTAAEARTQMAKHAKALGYQAIAFTIDEFVLWVQGISGGNYAAAVNALTALVDSSDVRALPFIVLTAVQRSIATVFPDDRSEGVLRERLKHVSARFREISLEDSDLVEIAQKRVLAPLPDLSEAWRAKVKEACRALADAKAGVLIGDQPAVVLEQLYPFHPALLRVLSDVTQGLQRERSSLFMLYQLLTTVRGDLRIGEVMSLGALWDVLFSPEQVESLAVYATRSDANNATARLLNTYAAWENLRESIRRESGGGDDERVLDLAVKSILLMQLSHSPFVDDLRGLDKVTTIENLYRLNRNELAARTERMGVIKIGDLLRKLAGAEPGTVSMTGEDAAALVKIELNAIDLSELLENLRPSASDRFGCLLGAARETLGHAPALKGGQEGRLSLTWRATEFSGKIRFESYHQFSVSGKSSTLEMDAGDAFKVAVLLEDNANGGAQEAAENARARVESARDQTQAWSLVWIPAPLSAAGRDALERLAKLEVFRRDPEMYLARFKGSDHPHVRQSLDAMAATSQSALKEALEQAYGDASRVVTMRKDVPEIHVPVNTAMTQRARSFASTLLELRYRQYPKFLKTPISTVLNRVLDLYRRLLEAPKDNAFSGEELEAIHAIGEPLELFEPGLGVTNLRASGVYLTRLKQWFDEGDRSVRILIARFADEPWGLSQAVTQALITVLTTREGLRISVDGATITIDRCSDVDPRGSISRGALPTPAEWSDAREAAKLFLNIKDIPMSHTLASADALVDALTEPAKRATSELQRCINAFTALREHSAYTGENVVEARYRSAYRELLALGDQKQMIGRLAGLDIACCRAVVAGARDNAAALEEIGQFTYLDEVIGGSSDLRAHLSRVLNDDSPSLAPQLKTWRTAAERWIAERLHRNDAMERPDPRSEAEDRRPSPEVANRKTCVRTVTLEHWDGNLAQIMGRVKGALSDALGEAHAKGRSISIELRVDIESDPES